MILYIWYFIIIIKDFNIYNIVTNGQQKKIPKLKKLSVNDNIVCCQNLLLNQTVVDNHIFSATKIKLRKYKSCHEDARKNGTSTDSKIVPFAVDTLGNFCSNLIYAHNLFFNLLMIILTLQKNTITEAIISISH